MMKCGSWHIDWKFTWEKVDEGFKHAPILVEWFHFVQTVVGLEHFTVAD